MKDYNTNLIDHRCVYEPQDCDICPGCGEHAEFCESCGSECCGVFSYNLD